MSFRNLHPMYVSSIQSISYSAINSDLLPAVIERFQLWHLAGKILGKTVIDGQILGTE